MKIAKFLSRLSVLAIMATLVGACGGKDSSFSLLGTGDTFVQSPSALNSKVDILWVIDNSGSMETSQTHLRNNFNSFIQGFIDTELDYKMAVVATDSWQVNFGSQPHACSTFRDGLLGYTNCQTVAGYAHSGVRVIDRFTANLANVFMINVSLTDDANNQWGYGDERAFSSFQASLEEPNNAGFLRPGAFLAVVILSDEDDFSHSGSNMNESYSNPNLYSVRSFRNYLDTKTSSSDTSLHFNVSSINIMDSACRTSLGGGARKIGQRYMQFVDDVNARFTVDALKGKKSSICQPFAQTLADIGSGIRSLAQQFFLERIPVVETIHVVVDGVVVPPDTGTGGWTYNATDNSIVFVGDAYIPNAGALISVTYDPVAYGS